MLSEPLSREIKEADMHRCILGATITVGLVCQAVSAGAASPTSDEMKQAHQWALAMFQGKSITTTSQGPKLNGLPFSFIYDGKPFDPTAGAWQKSVSSKKLDKQRTEHILVYTDSKTGLTARCTAIEYRDLPAVEWILHFTNNGSKNTPIIENIQPLDLQIKGNKDWYTLHHSLGDSNSAESFKYIDRQLKPGEPNFILAPDAGRSSEGAFPFFNLDWGSGGAAIAVGWSGQWQADFGYVEDGNLRARAGMQKTHLTLHPGETIRTPRMLTVFWQGDKPVRGNNLLRQTMMAHYLPKRDGKLVMAPICGSVNTVDPDGSYEGPHLRAVPLHAKCGIEVFWSDMDPQQWYPVGFPTGTGTWEVDPVKYPNGLKPIGDAVRANGMQYLLWFEPERVHAGTKIDREHPEFVMKRDNDDGRLFHLDAPAARKWLTDLIDEHISAAGLGWLRWDFNIQPLSFWQNNDAEGRQGITEIRYIEGLYAMWDDLRTRHPGLVIDNCASGGRRIDLETCMRGLPLWHSDRQCFGPDADADQMQNVGLNMWIPMHGCGNFGLEPSYLFRSGMTAGNILVESFSQDFPDSLQPEHEEAVKRSVALYKKLRPYMLGDFYPLFSFNTSDQIWYGYQFHRPDMNSGYAMLFRRKNCPDQSIIIKLNGIDTDSRYEISFEDSSEKIIKLGAELSTVQITVPSAPGSAIVYYRKIK